MLVMVAALAAQAMATHGAGAHIASGAHAAVTKNGAAWSLVYTFDKSAPGWIFPVSAPRFADHQPWREGAWRVATSGVRIERRGAYDVLVPVKGRNVPRTVRITVTPTAATLDREYDPAVSFSNGAVALYSDQFDLVPTNRPDKVEQLEPGLPIEELGGSSIPIRFRDTSGPLFAQGRRQSEALLTGAQTYVVFGAGKIDKVAGVAMLADPQLPPWLRSDVAAFVPRVAAHYASRIGERSDRALPLLLIGWRGATPGKLINDGGVRPGQILLNFEGEGLLERNQKAARRTRWFLAHELAHFWLGSSGVGYRVPGEAWITEGGADMMAFTLLSSSDPDYARSEVQRAVDDCVALGTRPVADAERRHESRAFYACGTLFALAAAAAERRDGEGDFFDFIRPLIAAHRLDKRLAGQEWIDRFAAVVRNDAAVGAMHSLIDKGSDRPAELVATILAGAGVPFTRKGAAILLSDGAI